MSTLITLPNKLNPETPLSDNLNLINDNFNRVLSDTGILQPAFVYPPEIAHYNRLVVAGGTLNLVVIVFGPTATSVPVAMLPEFSIYIDSLTPVLDPTLIFPDGTSLTDGMRKFRYGAITQLTPNFGSAGAPGAPGITLGTPLAIAIGEQPLYVVGGIVLTLNNADSADHEYDILIDVKSFTLEQYSALR